MTMHQSRFFTAATVLAATVFFNGLFAQGVSSIPKYSLFAMPALQPVHEELVGRLKAAIEGADYKAMQEVCEAAVKIFPEDAVWHYNLACAYARRGRPREAIQILEKAVNFGFINADQIADDRDLATLRRDSKFAEILDLARDYSSNPEKMPHRAKASLVGKKAVVAKENTLWDMENGGFVTLFKFPEYVKPGTNLFVRIPGEVGDLVRKWQLEGTAAGNYGDLYNNLDAGHSVLDMKLFPEMVPVAYCAEAVSNNIHTMGATMFGFGGIPVIGNCSMAMTEGPNWRSIARFAQGMTFSYLVNEYLGNQMYVYPQHHDYLPAIAEDVFPARTPYMYISPGSSWTDKPVLTELAVAMAALRPETKRFLVSGRLLAPTMMYLMRASQKRIEKREDYLEPASHPLITDGMAVDTRRLVELAHSMETNSLPPFVAMRIIAEEGTEGHPGVDFFDNVSSERLFDSPFAIARVFRNMNYTRKYTLNAMPVNPTPGTKYKFHWIVVQGDPEHVRIKKSGDNGHTAEVEIDYQGPLFDTPFGVRSSRVDIALVSDDGTHYSPPAFFTCFFLRNEERCYSEDHKILSVDYSAAKDRYVDPFVSIQKDWRDLYSYSDDGRLEGWVRMALGKKATKYTADGRRVVGLDINGKPTGTVEVKYVPRQIETADGPAMALKEE